jgi:hypothetical protein
MVFGEGEYIDSFLRRVEPDSNVLRENFIGKVAPDGRTEDLFLQSYSM